jgi:putative flippase GtrA
MLRRILRNLHSGPLALQLRRFVVVGAVTAGIQQVLLWVFINVAGLFYLLAALFSIEITIVLSYVLNNKTNMVRGTAIPIQLGILYALVESGALEPLVASGWTEPLMTSGALEPLVASIWPIEPLVANAVAILVSGLYRYVLDAKWTWGQ